MKWFWFEHEGNIIKNYYIPIVGFESVAINIGWKNCILYLKIYILKMIVIFFTFS